MPPINAEEIEKRRIENIHLSQLSFMICPGCGNIIVIRNEVVSEIIQERKSYRLKPVDMFRRLSETNYMTVNGAYDVSHDDDCEYHTTLWKRIRSQGGD